MRWKLVLLPMLAAAFLTAILKAAQFRDEVSAAKSLGMPVDLPLRQASLHTVPAAAFVAGLVAAGLAILLRAKTDEGAATNIHPPSPPN